MIALFSLSPSLSPHCSSYRVTLCSKCAISCLEVRRCELVPYQLLWLTGVATWTVRLVPIQKHPPCLVPFACGNGPNQLQSLLL